MGGGQQQATARYMLTCACNSDMMTSQVVAMKADDEEAVYWALGLLHEIAVQHVGKDEIKATPRLVPTMQHVLASSEAATQKIVLRTAGFLAIKDAEFKRRLLTTPFIERLIVCLSSSENEVAHWSIVLLHDVAMLGVEACRKIMESPEIIHAMYNTITPLIIHAMYNTITTSILVTRKDHDGGVPWSSRNVVPRTAPSVSTLGG